MKERMKLYGYDIEAHHAEIAKIKSTEQRSKSSKPGNLPGAKETVRPD